MSNLYKQAIDEYIVKYSNFNEIIISNNLLNKIEDFSKKIEIKKLQESQYKTDGRSISTRFSTGIFSEVALECFLNVSFVNWNIGISKDYAKPDLYPLNINMGIKSVRSGCFPIIEKITKYPQIIIIKETTNKAIILGVASIEVLKKYQDDSLVKDIRILQNGRKTCLSNFSNLIPFKTLDELKTISLNNP